MNFWIELNKKFELNCTHELNWGLNLNWNELWTELRFEFEPKWTAELNWVLNLNRNELLNWTEKMWGTGKLNWTELWKIDELAHHWLRLINEKKKMSFQSVYFIIEPGLQLYIIHCCNTIFFKVTNCLCSLLQCQFDKVFVDWRHRRQNPHLRCWWCNGLQKCHYCAAVVQPCMEP